MKSKNTWSLTVLISGIVLSITGIFLIGVYLLEAVISRIGEPDQSLLFWYLPFLFLGLFALVTGLIIGIRGISGIRNINISRSFSFVFTLFLMIVITVPLSIIVTILLVPLWSWFEASTGIESLGHSGPAEWCYAIVFFLVAAAAAIIFMVRRHRRKIKL